MPHRDGWDSDDGHSSEWSRSGSLRGLFACPLPGCAFECANNTNVVLHILEKKHESMSRVQFDSYVLNSPLRRLTVAVGNLHRTYRGVYSRRAPIVSAAIEDEEADCLWDGNEYVCDRGECRATFSSRVAVLAHLRSPAHDGKIYKCKDTDRHGGCGRRFSTLGALLQHIDRGCNRDDEDSIKECLARVLNRQVPAAPDYFCVPIIF